MLTWLRSVANRLNLTRQRTVSLIADWLANALWLIDTAFLSIAKQSYGSNAIAYACVRLLSQSIPEAPLKAYVSGSDGEETELDPLHPLCRLIAHPNELQTEFEFWELTTMFLAIAGIAPWWKQRDNAGNVIALWPLRPDRIGPIYSTSDQPGERLLLGYSYQDPGTGAYVPLARRDVIAFNLPNPAGESGGIVEGLGPLQVLSREVAADNEATNFVGSLVKNYATPGLVVKAKATVRDEEEAKLIKAKIAYEFGGENRGKVGLLDADSEVQVLGFSLQQLEFPDLRAVAESRIAAAVGVPAILVGLKTGLDRSTFANFAESRQFFAETTLSVYWRRYSDQVTSDLAPEFGEGIVCRFDTSGVRALAAQRIEQMKPIADGFKAGAVTVNEYRAELGLVPLAGGDVRMVPSNAVELPAEVEQPAARALGMRYLGSGRTAIRAVDPRDEAEGRLRRALVEMFDGLAPEVARRIAAGEPVSDEELSEAFRRVIEPELVKTTTAEGLAIGARIGVQFDPAAVNTAAVEWARGYSYELVKGITSTSRQVIAHATEQFLTVPGMTVGDLRGLLQPAFSLARAESIATTEVTRAVSEATNHYQREIAKSGIKMLRTWNTANDELTCPVCRPLNGKSEVEWAGEFPDGPPAHPRCRCASSLRVSK